MSTTIPYGEPDILHVGDSWQWKKSLSDYPASTWTLTYSLLSSTTKITLTGSASGTDHLIDISASTTAAYTAGWYDWVARVSDGTDSFTVGYGRIELLPDLEAASSYDNRSHARKVLDAIESVIEGRASQDADTITHNGRSLARTPIEDLLKLRSKYKSEVDAEDQAERIRSGLNSGRMVRVRLAS